MLAKVLSCLHVTQLTAHATAADCASLGSTAVVSQQSVAMAPRRRLAARSHLRGSPAHALPAKTRQKRTGPLKATVRPRGSYSGALRSAG